MLPQWGCRRRLNHVLPKTTTTPFVSFSHDKIPRRKKMPWHVSLSHFFKNLLGKTSVQKWWAFTSIWWCYSSDMSYYILKILINHCVCALWIFELSALFNSWSADVRTFFWLVLALLLWRHTYPHPRPNNDNIIWKSCLI